MFYSPLIIIFLSILIIFVVIITILVFVTRWRKTVSSGGSASAGTAGLVSPGTTTITGGNGKPEITQTTKPLESSPSALLMEKYSSVDSTNLQLSQNTDSGQENELYVNLKNKPATAFESNRNIKRSAGGLQAGDLLSDIASSRGKFII